MSAARQLRRVAMSAGGVFAVATAIAGCGGGASTPGVANISTTTATSSTAGAGTQVPGLLAYASCMRAHGVPNFPDPAGDAGNEKEAVVSALRRVSNSQVKAAQTACLHLQPRGGGGQPTPAQLAQHLRDLLAFAGCMRTHGIANFPDPTSSGQITHGMLAGAGVNLHQPGVLPAADACVSVTHGALTKAAVARFAAGH
jgi:hypothetical protein